MMTLWPRQAPSLIIGHRGAMGYAPENTLASFEEAVRRGADLIEMDVQLTSDGEVVVMHDTSVDRTTNGEGLVRDLTLKKLQSLDAGFWYNPEFIHEYVPSLAAVIRRFRDRNTSRGQALGFIIELKTAHGLSVALSQAVVALLEKWNFLERAFLISFDVVALQEVRQVNKTLPTGLLYSEEGEESRIEQAKGLGAQALCPRKTCVTARGVQAAHKAGLAVSTWTANTRNEMKRMISCGVDAITTNYPDRLRSLMG